LRIFRKRFCAKQLDARSASFSFCAKGFLPEGVFSASAFLQKPKVSEISKNFRSLQMCVYMHKRVFRKRFCLVNFQFTCTGESLIRHVRACQRKRVFAGRRIFRQRFSAFTCRKGLLRKRASRFTMLRS
jgi:hypothetical protein